MSDRMLSDEILLGIINSKSGGGGGGTDNYNDLKNQPQIGGNTLVGNKTASDLGLVAAETGKGLSTNDYTNADKAIVGGVTAALAGKQNVLTAGDYIAFNSNEISVNRDLVPHQTSYRIKGTGRYTMNITKYIDGVESSSTNYSWVQGTSFIVDNAFSVTEPNDYTYGYSWRFEWLKNSSTHDAGYVKWANAYNADFDFTEVFNDEDLSGYKLVIKSEMDTALAGKQATLTFDDVPTDGSNNPVKSNGVYDALVTKQNATDNNLQTTDKTVVGAVNELKSGLTNVETQLSELKVYKKWANSITVPGGMNTIVMYAGMSGQSNMFTYNSYTDVLTPIGNSSGVTATKDASTDTVTFSANKGGSFAVYVL